MVRGHLGYELKSGLHLYPVKPRDSGYIWPEVSGFFEEAIEKTKSPLTTGDLRRDVLSGDRQLWVIRDDEIVAAFLTHINTSYGVSYGVIAFAGGSGHEDWVEIVEPVSDWLRCEGAQFLEIIGRKGWERPLKKYGFEFAEIKLRKKL